MFSDLFSESEAEFGASVSAAERRRDPREDCDDVVFLIDNRTPALIAARCVDASRGGLRLLVPDEAPVHVGQRFVVSTQLPGQSAPPGSHLLPMRRVVVVRADPNDESRHFDVGVVVDLRRATRHDEDRAI